MTVNKITTPPSQKTVIDKINEVIDNLGGQGTAPVWGNISGTLSNQTDLQSALNDKYDASNPDGFITGITSSDVTTALGYTPYNASNPNGYITQSELTTPLRYGSKFSLQVNISTGVVRLNPIGFLSGGAQTYPTISYSTLLIPTTQRGNRVLDTRNVMYYVGDIKDKTIIFQNEYSNNNSFRSDVVIGKIDTDGTFTPYYWTDSVNNSLLGLDILSGTGNNVQQGITETYYNTIPTGYNSTTTTGSVSLDYVTISNVSDKVNVSWNKQTGADYENDRLLITSIKDEDYDTFDANCVIFCLDTTNNVYYAQNFSIVDNNTSQTIWTPSTQGPFYYATLPIGTGITVNSSGILVPDLKTINGQSILGGGNLQTPYRNIGEIVSSTIPLTDAGLHLLDGALISGSGSYSAFVDYIVDLYDSGNYSDLFETEANWQTSVTTYGVCGKFVYDSVNNTVRLPKVTGFVEGTIDASVLGDLVEAGLPNITGTVGQTGYDTVPSGAFLQNGTAGGFQAGSFSFKIADFNASRSNSIYGNSTTVQPQAIKVLYYIVVATSTKTSIQVDIDEIATDLNGKCDVDLTNCTKPHIVETYVNGSSWYRVYSDGWIEQGGDTTLSTNNWQTINFIKPFTNTNYNLVISQGTTGRGAVNAAIISSKIDNSSAEWTLYNATGTAQWLACGY